MPNSLPWWEATYFDGQIGKRWSVAVWFNWGDIRIDIPDGRVRNWSVSAVHCIQKHAGDRAVLGYGNSEERLTVPSAVLSLFPISSARCRHPGIGALLLCAIVIQCFVAAIALMSYPVQVLAEYTPYSTRIDDGLSRLSRTIERLGGAKAEFCNDPDGLAALEKFTAAISPAGESSFRPQVLVLRSYRPFGAAIGAGIVLLTSRVTWGLRTRPSLRR